MLLALLASFLQPILSAPDVPTLIVGRDFPERRADEEDSGLCPWRDPEGDKARFFSTLEPGLYSRDETLVLTRQRALMTKLLGRTPTGQENALQLHRVYRKSGHAAQSDVPAGTIVTRTVRGESGVIELALAVDAREQVIGARLQRLREPESVARELQSARFLNSFRGKTYTSNWSLEPQLAGISPTSHASAAAVLDGARTALVLLHIGNQTLAERKHPVTAHP